MYIKFQFIYKEYSFVLCDSLLPLTGCVTHIHLWKLIHNFQKNKIFCPFFLPILCAGVLCAVVVRKGVLCEVLTRHHYIFRQTRVIRVCVLLPYYREDLWLSGMSGLSGN